MSIRKYLLSALMITASSPALAETSRWYLDDQVKLGQQIFKRKCAKCHGADAEGEDNWRFIDEKGEYPPPPLNGKAYAWHHTLDQLRLQIQIGSGDQDSEMPSFQNKLQPEEIDAVIAYFQSKWSNSTYEAWQFRENPLADPTRSKEQARQHMGTHWLKQHLSAAKITPGEPMKTPVEGIREVRIKDEYIYLSEDGRYAFTGNLIDLRNGLNLTELNQAMETKKQLQAFSPKNMLVYPAQGEERTQLTIFTDTSCNYCRKMHEEVPRLQSKGVTVRYIPYPRRGLNGKGYAQLKSIWCSEDPQLALSSYIEKEVLPDNRTECNKAGAVDAGYQLGNSVGISGTPFLVLESGERIKGYKPASEVISRMNMAL